MVSSENVGNPGYFWYCHTHGSCGWALDEEEVFDTAGYHETGWIPNSSQEAAAQIAINLCETDGAGPDELAVVGVINKIRSTPQFMMLPSEFWNVYSNGEFDENLCWDLVQKILVSPCFTSVVDLSTAVHIASEYPEEVRKIMNSERVPQAVAAQMFRDIMTMGDDLGHKGRELMEDIDEFLREQGV